MRCVWKDGQRLWTSDNHTQDTTEWDNLKATDVAHSIAHIFYVRNNCKVKRIKVNSLADPLLSHDGKGIPI